MTGIIREEKVAFEGKELSVILLRFMDDFSVELREERDGTTIEHNGVDFLAEDQANEFFKLITERPELFYDETV